MITFAKGVTAGHAPLGGVIVRGRVAEPFVVRRQMYMHGLTWGGHPLSTAVGPRGAGHHRAGRRPRPRADPGAATSRPALDGMRELPLVGDVRGAGYFWALELVKDKETRETFTEGDECDWLLGDVLSERMVRAGCCAASTTAATRSSSCRRRSSRTWT